MKMFKLAIVQTVRAPGEMVVGLILACVLLMATLVGLGVGLGLTFA